LTTGCRAGRPSSDEVPTCTFCRGRMTLIAARARPAYPDRMEFSDVATSVAEWLAAGRRVALGRPVGFAGFSSRRLDEALAVSQDGQRVGEVVGRHVTDAVAAELVGLLAGEAAAVRLVRLVVDEPAASAAGLSCGGTVTVALHDAALVPAEFWRAAAAGRPVALVTHVSSAVGGALAVTADETVAGVSWDTALDGQAVTAARSLLAQARTVSRVVVGDTGSLVIEVVVPASRLVVVGDGGLADALARQAALLGWRSEIVGPALAATAAVGTLGPADGVVVLSHDATVDGPALAAALESRAGYIGALGSRRTQAARRERLLAGGIAPDALAAIHGPAGLDLGGRADAEIALAICAEMLAVRMGRAAGALREPTGAVNQ
jgi:xanthine dehydrogenase accessory factor